MTTKPLMQVVQEAIYQARWIDAFKEAGNMASDEHIAKAVVEAIPYEYNVETTDLITGHTHMLRTLWEPDTEWLERKKKALDDNDRALLNAGGGALEYTRRIVKRRKAGRIEDV